jgi:hypothetical protein
MAMAEAKWWEDEDWFFTADHKLPPVRLWRDLHNYADIGSSGSAQNPTITQKIAVVPWPEGLAKTTNQYFPWIWLSS